MGGLVVGAIVGAAMVYPPRATRRAWQIGTVVGVLVVLVALVVYRNRADRRLGLRVPGRPRSAACPLTRCADRRKPAHQPVGSAGCSPARCHQRRSTGPTVRGSTPSSVRPKTNSVVVDEVDLDGGAGGAHPPAAHLAHRSDGLPADLARTAQVPYHESIRSDGETPARRRSPARRRRRLRSRPRPGGRCGDAPNTAQAAAAISTPSSTMSTARCVDHVWAPGPGKDAVTRGPQFELCTAVVHIGEKSQGCCSMSGRCPADVGRPSAGQRRRLCRSATGQRPVSASAWS